MDKQGHSHIKQKDIGPRSQHLSCAENEEPTVTPLLYTTEKRAHNRKVSGSNDDDPLHLSCAQNEKPEHAILGCKGVEMNEERRKEHTPTGIKANSKQKTYTQWKEDHSRT